MYFLVEYDFEIVVEKRSSWKVGFSKDKKLEVDLVEQLRAAVSLCLDYSGQHALKIKF